MSQWGMRQTAELENNMTSVERVMEYIDLDSEDHNAVEHQNLINWPQNGSIEFINLSMRYFENSDPILKSLNLQIKPGEKIGKSINFLHFHMT